jgi:membrane protein implicated in regulation of membrane protease activity
VADGVPSVARAWFVYTALRMLVFLGAAAVLFLTLGLNGLPLLVVALLASSILSLVLLGPPRHRLVVANEARAEQRRDQRARQRERLDEGPGVSDI